VGLQKRRASAKKCGNDTKDTRLERLRRRLAWALDDGNEEKCGWVGCDLTESIMSRKGGMDSE